MQWKCNEKSILTVRLFQGERIFIDSNSVIAASKSINFTQTTNGTFSNGVKLMLAGKKMFELVAVANTNDGDVILGNYLNGDIITIEIDKGSTMLVAKDGLLMHTSNISVSSGFVNLIKKISGKSNNFCNLKIDGRGIVGLKSCGKLLKIEDPDLIISIDNIVAYVDSDIQPVKTTGLFSRLTGNSLSMVSVTGGIVWIQSIGVTQQVSYLVDNGLVHDNDIKTLRKNLDMNNKSSNELELSAQSLTEDFNNDITIMLNNMPIQERINIQKRLLEASKKGLAYRNEELSKLIKDGYPINLLSYFVKNLSCSDKNSIEYKNLMNL